MEFEEAHENLCAIRLLYRLLEDNSIALKDSNSENVSVFIIHALCSTDTSDQRHVWCLTTHVFLLYDYIQLCNFVKLLPVSTCVSVSWHALCSNDTGTFDQKCVWCSSVEHMSLCNMTPAHVITFNSVIFKNYYKYWFCVCVVGFFHECIRVFCFCL